MENENYKEIFFNVYCPTCKHETLDDDNEPCATCLETPARLNSHKPVKWEEK